MAVLPADARAAVTQDSGLTSRSSCMCVQRRNTTKSSREKQNREEEKLVTVAGPKGDTEWERTIDYINFGEQLWVAGGWGLQSVCAAPAEG